MYSNPIHPRGLFHRDEVPAFRKKLHLKPFSEMILALHSDIKRRDVQPPDPKGEQSRQLAVMYLCSGDRKWAELALDCLKPMLGDRDVFLNPVSKGLSRAGQVLNLAITYDLCCEAWEKEDQDIVGKALKKAVYRLAATMGEGGNYYIANNWNGVRWGAAAFASLVSDEPDCKYIGWEARIRLTDHLRANLSEQGWNPEGIGYYNYPWQYIGPALIAFKKCEHRDLIKEIPPAEQSFWPTLAGVVPIEHQGGLGLRSDLSDDHPVYRSAGVLGIAFELAPKEQIPALKWMFDHLCGSNGDGSFERENGILYHLLYYPFNIESSNPSKIMGLTHFDREHGIVMCRNRYRDRMDIVANYCAAGRRPKGAHSGPDTNTVRLQGLDNVWIVGGGRTGDPTGQTLLFPSESDRYESKGTGRLLHWSVEHDGSGYAIGEGSCVGTADHRRWMAVDYSQACGAPALFLVADRSLNGRRWRLNTPEFNTITVTEAGFLITASDGASLNASILGLNSGIQLKQGIVERGGGAGHVAFPFKGVKYIHNKWVECACEGSIIVVMTLQPAGQEHPPVKFKEWKEPISVGGQWLTIREDRVVFSR